MYSRAVGFIEIFSLLLRRTRLTGGPQIWPRLHISSPQDWTDVSLRGRETVVREVLGPGRDVKQPLAFSAPYSPCTLPPCFKCMVSVEAEIMPWCLPELTPGTLTCGIVRIALSLSLLACCVWLVFACVFVFGLQVKAGLDAAKKMIDLGGDWDRRNRLKVQYRCTPVTTGYSTYCTAGTFVLRLGVVYYHTFQVWYVAGSVPVRRFLAVWMA